MPVALALSWLRAAPAPLVLALTMLVGCATAPLTPPPPRVVDSEVRVLVVVTSANALMDGTAAGYYLPEVVDFYEVVNAAGIAIDIASPQGGQAPMYDRGPSVSGRQNNHFLTETGLLADLDHSIPLADVDPSRYAAVFYVGGFAAMMDFSSDPRVSEVGAQIYESGGVVSAVCHGPTALVNMKLSNGQYLVDGKRVTSRTIAEDGSNSQRLPFVLERALRDRGGDYSKAAPWTAYVVEDGRLITGQGPSSTQALAQKLVAQLTGSATP